MPIGEVACQLSYLPQPDKQLLYMEHQVSPLVVATPLPVAVHSDWQWVPAEKCGHCVALQLAWVPPYSPTHFQVHDPDAEAVPARHKPLDGG